MAFNSAGHIGVTTSGTPTLSVCNGAGSSLSGTDIAGTATSQTAAATQCTVTFATPFLNPPACVIMGYTAQPTTLSAATGQLTINFASANNYKFVWICFGA
jgi:hypothetical protein